MVFTRLSLEQVIDTYNKRMIEDFPPDELKPLEMILKAIDKGIYLCLGMVEDGKVINYAYFVKLGDDYLLDYFATIPESRNRGVGGKSLQALREYLKDARSILAEVEDPAFAKDEAEKEIQSRRYQFYLRNGFIDTNVKARCFGVPYIVIETGGLSDKETVCNNYKRLYKSVLPEKLYANNIII